MATAEELFDHELRKVHEEHDCGCEVCNRSGAVCPATASSLYLELAAVRLARNEAADALQRRIDEVEKYLAGLQGRPDRERLAVLSILRGEPTS